MINELFANTGPAQAPQAVDIKDMLLPLGLMFMVFYFLLIRPNQKKAKLREEFLSKIKKGDEVITTGGILGRVVGITDLYVTVDTGDNVKLKVLKSHIGFSAKEVQTEEKEINKK